MALIEKTSADSNLSAHLFSRNEKLRDLKITKVVLIALAAATACIVIISLTKRAGHLSTFINKAAANIRALKFMASIVKVIMIRSLKNRFPYFFTKKKPPENHKQFLGKKTAEIQQEFRSLALKSGEEQTTPSLVTSIKGNYFIARFPKGPETSQFWKEIFDKNISIIVTLPLLIKTI